MESVVGCVAPTKLNKSRKENELDIDSFTYIRMISYNISSIFTFNSYIDFNGIHLDQILVVVWHIQCHAKSYTL